MIQNKISDLRLYGLWFIKGVSEFVIRLDFLVFLMYCDLSCRELLIVIQIMLKECIQSVICNLFFNMVI